MRATTFLRRVNLGVRRRVGLRPPAPRVLGYDRGLRVLVDPADAVERHIYTEGDYEPQLVALIDAAVRPGDVTLDIGAHVGLHALIAAERVGPGGRVVAVEANPRTAERLTANVERNGFADRILIVRSAASDTRGEAELHLSDDPHNSGGASLQGQRTQTTTVTVPVAPLDELAPADLRDRVAFVKIDVEGHEPAALRGAAGLLSSRPVIVYEANAPETDDLLTGLGYRLFELGTPAHPVGAPFAGRRQAAWQPGRNIVAVHPDGPDRIRP